MTSDPFIPVCRPLLSGREKEYVLEALDSGWISSAGKYIIKFEEKFSSLVGCRYGVGCTNGTSAVHLALRSLDVQRNDRIVFPSFTMMASIFPAVMEGAIPVFVDSDPETWTLDPLELDKISGPVKAVVPVHIYGHPCDMDPIQQWAKLRHAFVLEDAAEAFGSLYKGKPCGSLSDVAAFSFYANKVLTTGEGGMVTTQHSEIAEKARYYRNLCFDPDLDKRFIHEHVGQNYRMTNIQGAIGLAQAECADKCVEMRRQMAFKYLERLKSLEDYLQLPVEKEWARNSYWMFGIVIRDHVPLNSTQVRTELGLRNIDSRRFFCPAHLQPALKRYSESVRAPVSERLWEQGIYLPSSPDLTDQEADRVFGALRDILVR